MKEEDSKINFPFNNLSNMNNLTTEKEKEDAQEEEKKEKRYNEWMNNCALLYNTILSKNTDWPSLSLQWLRSKEETYNEGENVVSHNLIFGTQTSEQEQNKLKIMQVLLPNKDRNKADLKELNSFQNSNLGESELTRINKKENEYYKYYKSLKKTVIVREFNHLGDVNKIRQHPLKREIVATKSSDGNAYVFNIEKETDLSKESNHELILTGHTDEGYGLSWSNDGSNLVSGGYDNKICLYDSNFKITSNLKPEIHAITTFSHSQPVEDVCFSKQESYLFASVSDDKSLILWDTRGKSKVMEKKEAHSENINSVDFNYKNSFSLITGSADKTTGLWDIRNLSRKLFNFDFHSSEVVSVKFSPNSDCLFSSSSSDGQILFWDITLIGSPLSTDDFEDGPPELLFIHNGHRSRVNDFDWSSASSSLASYSNLLCSTEESNNIIQIYDIKEKNLPENESKVKIM